MYEEPSDDTEDGGECEEGELLCDNVLSELVEAKPRRPFVAYKGNLYCQPTFTSKRLGLVRVCKLENDCMYPSQLFQSWQ